MIQEALRRLEIDCPVFVEIGAADGTENCTRNLLSRGGTGLWIEGSKDLALKATESFANSPVDISHQFVTDTNVVESISSSKRVADGFDVLVMDVDGNDWWLLQKILRYYRPSLIVAEYNAAYGPTAKWVMNYNESHTWGQDRLYGASLSSYNKLMKRFGYRLVACDPQGVNAFWVKRNKRFLFAKNSKSKFHFAPMQPFSMHPEHGTGHMEHPLSSAEINCVSTISAESMTVRELKAVLVSVHNSTQHNLSSIGKFPVRVGLKTSQEETTEPTRAKFLGNVPSGSITSVYFQIDMDIEEIWIAPVQEGVLWGDWKKFHL